MPAQDDYERFSGIADELELEDEDRDRFINSAMKRKGYKPRMAWDDPEPEGSHEKDDDFFTSKRKGKQEGQGQQRQQREVEQRRASGGFQYE